MDEIYPTRTETTTDMQFMPSYNWSNGLRGSHPLYSALSSIGGKGDLVG